MLSIFCREGARSRGGGENPVFGSGGVLCLPAPLPQARRMPPRFCALPSPGPVFFCYCFAVRHGSTVALPLSSLSSCPSSPLACSLSWQTPTTLHFSLWATSVPVARRSLPRLAPSVRASPRGTACTGTLSCSAQAPNVAPAKGGFYDAPVRRGSTGPAACSAGTRCAASGALLLPPSATYTSGKTPVPRRSPADSALSASWYPPRPRPPYAFILPPLVALFVRSFAPFRTQKRRSLTAAPSE